MNIVKMALPPKEIYRFNAAAAAAKLLLSCTTLCDPIDSSPPGSAAGKSEERVHIEPLADHENPIFVVVAQPGRIDDERPGELAVNTEALIQRDPGGGRP